MGLSKLAPSRVYQTASLLLNTTHTNAPPWFKSIGSIPPSEILTRTQPTQHRDTRVNSKIRKPSKMFRPQLIVYEEDRIRQTFYRDHPWELARPRIVLEEDGKDGHNCDWSKMQQAGRRLNGESVVQRQLWLLHNAQGITDAQAYDIARKEFYTLRHEEEVEKRVAREEALSTGAYFGKSVLEVGMMLEDKIYEQWKQWATTEIETMERQRASAYTGIGTQNEDVAVESAVDEESEEEEELLV